MSQSEATTAAIASLWTIDRNGGAFDFDSEFFELAVERWTRATKDLCAAPDIA
jgi:hypothetical protein